MIKHDNFIGAVVSGSSAANIKVVAGIIIHQRPISNMLLKAATSILNMIGWDIDNLAEWLKSGKNTLKYIPTKNPN